MLFVGKSIYMSGSLNKVTLIGNLGKDPEIRSMQNGRQMASLTIATNESWKDKTTGERRDKTEWHNVVIFSEGLVKVCQNYLKKGSKVYIEGQLQTRKWQDQDGRDRYTTEVVLQGYNATLVMLDNRNSNEGGAGFSNNNSMASPVFGQGADTSSSSQAPSFVKELDDEIPF